MYHIEEDLFKHGNILFSDGSSLKTTNGIATSLIAGNASVQGHNESTGDTARFRNITGFLQDVFEWRVLAVDSGNMCLRTIDRRTNETEPAVGHCGGMDPDDPSVSFISPSKVMYDIRDSKRIFIIDYKKIYCLVELQKMTISVTTNVEIRGLTQDSATGDLYMMFKQHITLVKYNDIYFRRVAGALSSSIIFNDGPFSRSRFGDLRDILLINKGTQILVADFRNQRMRVLDLRGNMTKSFCGHLYQFCNNSIVPESLGVVDGNLYIGSNKSIMRIQGAASTPVTKEILNSSTYNYVSRTMSSPLLVSPRLVSGITLLSQTLI